MPQPHQEKIHAVLVLLAIRSLGKSKAVANQCPQNERSPENVVLHLIEEYQNVVPSVQALNAAGIKYAKGALHLHSMFNLAQMLQVENVPANVCQLQESIKRDGVEALRFYILFLLGFMSGDSAWHFCYAPNSLKDFKGMIVGNLIFGQLSFVAFHYVEMLELDVHGFANPGACLMTLCGEPAVQQS